MCMSHGRPVHVCQGWAGKCCITVLTCDVHKDILVLESIHRCILRLVLPYQRFGWSTISLQCPHQKVFRVTVLVKRLTTKLGAHDLSPVYNCLSLAHDLSVRFTIAYVFPRRGSWLPGVHLNREGSPVSSPHGFNFLVIFLACMLEIE